MALIPYRVDASILHRNHIQFILGLSVRGSSQPHPRVSIDLPSHGSLAQSLGIGDVLSVDSRIFGYGVKSGTRWTISESDYLLGGLWKYLLKVKQLGTVTHLPYTPPEKRKPVQFLVEMEL